MLTVTERSFCPHASYTVEAMNGAKMYKNCCKFKSFKITHSRDVSLFIRALLPSDNTAFDIVILSDLLHFDSSHDVLVKSLSLLLAKTTDARVYVAVCIATIGSLG